MAKVFKKIKNFLYPNRGILGAFAVWVGLLIVSILSVASSEVMQDPSSIVVSFFLNLPIMYLLTCLSIWTYERVK